MFLWYLLWFIIFFIANGVRKSVCTWTSLRPLRLEAYLPQLDYFMPVRLRSDDIQLISVSMVSLYDGYAVVVRMIVLNAISLETNTCANLAYV
jgi:hypothetical protein